MAPFQLTAQWTGDNLEEIQQVVSQNGQTFWGARLAEDGVTVEIAYDNGPTNLTMSIGQWILPYPEVVDEDPSAGSQILPGPGPYYYQVATTPPEL